MVRANRCLCLAGPVMGVRPLGRDRQEMVSVQ